MVRIVYRNHRGEVAIRRVVPCFMHFGQSQWHPEQQWTLHAWDEDKQEKRDFAMKDILAWLGPDKESP